MWIRGTENFRVRFHIEDIEDDSLVQNSLLQNAPLCMNNKNINFLPF